MNQETTVEQINTTRKKRGIKQRWSEFWNKDTDTIIYTLMCVTMVPALIIGFFYLEFAKMQLPEEIKGCVFQKVAGVYCPGCGGTRAFWALFSGNILMAIYYHPAAVYGVGLYLVYFISQTLMRLSKGKLWGMTLRPMYLYIMVGLILLNFVVRNVLLMGFGIETL